MDLFNSFTFRLLEEGESALWQRQQVIAQNITNADTPGYKSKTLDFQTLLQQKCDSPLHHYAAKQQNQPLLQVRVRQNNNTSRRLDGNNVDRDQENVELARAQIQYNYVLQRITGSIKRVNSVIEEGRR